MTGFGANILAQYVQDRGGVEAHLTRLNPPALVVMDDHGWAVSLKRKFPDCQVIYRGYREDDKELHTRMSAAEIWAAHRAFAIDGVIPQIWNEPDGYNNLRPFCAAAAEVIRLAAAEGKRVAVPHWGVGHPDTGAVLRGEADELINAFYQFPQMPICFHEYAERDPHAEQPYRIGRFLTFLDRAKAIGKPLDPARIVLTEAGRDVGGGENDGWRNVFTSSQYAVFLLGLAMIYEAYGIRAICPFCIGKGGGKPGEEGWRNFDYGGDDTLYAFMETWNRNHPMTTTPVYTLPAATDSRWAAYTVQSSGGSTNIRRTPDVVAGNVLGAVAKPVKAWLILAAAAIRPDGKWLPIKLQNGVVGWARADVIKYALPSLPDDRVIAAPYASQWTRANGAAWESGRTGMCGTASVYMGLAWDRNTRLAGVIMPSEITVDSIADYIGLGKDDFSTMAGLLRALNAYGLRARSTLSLTIASLRAEIDAGRPAIALIEYRHILGRRDQKFELGHILVIVGYNPVTGEIIVHDPDYLRGEGAALRIPAAQFEKALADTGLSENAPHQGIVFA